MTGSITDFSLAAVCSGVSLARGRNSSASSAPLSITSAIEDLPTSRRCPARRDAVFVRPELVAHVNFTEWTHDGVMRHPSFQGLREDKPAPEVVREKEKAPPVKKSSASKKQATKAADEVTLTHPDKQLYPGSSITKRDLADYYEKVAPLMLAQIAGRPIGLVRCPAGEGKPCFFQRHGAESSRPSSSP
jgi:bifunctional non-homologous end joining protein LigD